MNVHVPGYVVRSTISVLRILADVVGRKDVHEQVREARKIAKVFENLIERQAWPRGVAVVDQVQIPKCASGAWKPSLRAQSFTAAMRELEARFMEMDEESKGGESFYVVLTKTYGKA